MDFASKPSCIRALEDRFFEPTEFERRRLFIGAGSFATAAGLNPHSSPSNLFAGKIGNFSRPRNSANAQRGIRSEAFAIELFCRTFKLQCLRTRDGSPRKIPAVRSQEYPWLVAYADGLCLNGALIEIKCRTKRCFTQKRIEYFYFVQVQVLLFVLKLHRAYFVEYCPELSIIRTTKIKFDKKFFFRHLAKVEKFVRSLWLTLLNPPNPLGFETPWDQDETKKPGCFFLQLPPQTSSEKSTSSSESESESGMPNMRAVST